MPTLSDLPVELLFKIYTRLPYGTTPWCRRTLRISRDPLYQIRMYIDFRSSAVLSQEESLLSARLLASRVDLTSCTAAVALQQFGDVLPTYYWGVTREWGKKPSYENPLAHAVLELVLTCQRQNRMDLFQRLCASYEELPPDSIDVGTAIGQQIVSWLHGTVAKAHHFAYQLITAAFLRSDDNSALAILNMPIFEQETNLTNDCVVKAFYFGRVGAFRELIENPGYHVIGNWWTQDVLDFKSQYSMSPIASADLFIYCVENDVFSGNIWSYVSIWNDMPTIASYVALHPNTVPQICISQTWRLMRLAVGRLAPNVVAKILINLSVNLEDLWADQICPFITRCPHIVEDIEAQLWAFLLAGGRFSGRRFKLLLRNIKKDMPTYYPGRYSARSMMLIVEIATKYQLSYRNTDDLTSINIEKEMWCPTSTRVDVDYW